MIYQPNAILSTSRRKTWPVKTKRINSIMSTVTDGIVLQDPSGAIVDVNKSAEQILGLSRDRLMGRSNLNSDWQTIREDGSVYPSEQHPAMRALRTAQPVRNQVMGVHKNDDKITWILVNSVPVLSKGKGAVQYAVTTFTDITSLKESEKNLAFSLDALTEKNHRLQNFAHTVSHNLRSHAGNIYSLLKFFNESALEVEKNELLQHLTSAAKTLNQTIRDLTQVVETETHSKANKIPISIKDYVQRILTILRADIDSQHIEIIVSMASDFTIQYNPSYFESILLNLITNAIKYRQPTRNTVIEINVKNNNGEVVMEVRDNGRGIDLARFGDRLFSMYETFHGNEDARGVGLFLTKSQVETMGGKIEVESVVNQGTVFRVFLGASND
jgi:PAS domain S-box-containing protein